MICSYTDIKTPNHRDMKRIFKTEKTLGDTCSREITGGRPYGREISSGVFCLWEVNHEKENGEDRVQGQHEKG